MSFDTKVPKKTSLQDFAKEQLPEILHKFIPSSFEIVGDIAILEVPKELVEYEQVLGESILKVNKVIKTVLKKVGLHGGEFRTQPLAYLSGEEKFETIYKENNILLKLDPSAVYFSARLSTEREILCSKVKANKKVLVMFSGCGPYTYVTLRKQPNVLRIDSVELNPQGHKYAIESLDLNESLLKKSKLFEETILFCKNNGIPISEKLILQNINKLKIHFFNDDVAKFSKENRLQLVNNYLESSENWIFEKQGKEAYEKLQKFDSGRLYISLKNIKNYENYKFLLILFANKFEFVIYENEEETYLCDSDLTKGFLLSLFEKKEENLNSVVLYDEIFMPLPKDAQLFLDSAFRVADEKCLIHMYDFVHENDFPKQTEEAVLRIAKENKVVVTIIETRKVGQYSPGKYRVCCDFIVERKI